jgi:DNA-binding MarR family transcriptional regulator
LALDLDDPLAQFSSDVFNAASVLRRYREQLGTVAGQTPARQQLLSGISGSDWTMRTAAEQLGVRRQAVHRVASELVHDGLTTLVDNPDDTTDPFLRLTAAGTDVVAEMESRWKTRQETLSDRLGMLDLSAAQDILQRVVAAVRTELDAEELVSGT